MAARRVHGPSRDAVGRVLREPDGRFELFPRLDPRDHHAVGADVEGTLDRAAVEFRDPHERWRGVNHAGPGLDAFLSAELERHDLPASKLALVGFSQGTMMALHVALRRPAPVAAVLGYSGMLVVEDGKGPESLKAQIRAKPPILLVHGDRDDVIPVEALFMTSDALGVAEIPCQWHLSAGVAHGIDAEGLRHGGLFLTQSFGLPYPG